MSLSSPKTITEVFAAHGVKSGHVCLLLECQELALAVTLQGKYHVTLDTGHYGINCSSYLANTSAHDVSWRSSFTSCDLADINLIRKHLHYLLADGASQEVTA